MTELNSELVSFFNDSSIDIADKYDKFTTLPAEEKRSLLLSMPDVKAELMKHKTSVVSNKTALKKTSFNVSAPTNATPFKKKKSTPSLMTDTPEITLMKKRISRKKSIYNELLNCCFEQGQFWKYMCDEIIHSYNSLEMNMKLKRATTEAEKDQIRKIFNAERNATAKAFDRALVLALADNKAPITEEDIKELHRLVLETEPERAGVYRQIKVRFPDTQTVLPNYMKVPELMADMVKNVNKISSPIERALKFHFDMAGIHPFTDGNGRTSRLLMNTILIQNNLPPIIIDPKDRAQYIKTLETYSVKGNDRPYRLFMLKQLEKSLTMAVSRLRFLPHTLSNTEEREIRWNRKRSIKRRMSNSHSR